GQFDRLGAQHGMRGRCRLWAQRAGSGVDAVLGDGVVGDGDDVGVLAVGRDLDFVGVAWWGDDRGLLGGEFAGGRVDGVLPEQVDGDVEAFAVGGDCDPVGAVS